MANTNYSPVTENVSVEYFQFEKDFIENGIRCIPMIVRYKLDLSGVKLKLREWSRFTETERETLAEMPCNNPAAIHSYRNTVTALVVERCGTLPDFIIPENSPRWNNTTEIDPDVYAQAQLYRKSISLSDWISLSALQRFSLLKLCRPGHENRNFPLALNEFGLA